jgi:hypothetical protein
MIKQIINDFRRDNGSPWANMTHYSEDNHCLLHCLHMTRVKNVCHAPEHLRPGKSEACAVRGFFHDPHETLRAIIYDQFGNSPGHRDILINSENLACAWIIDQYQVFVTVRGW